MSRAPRVAKRRGRVYVDLEVRVRSTRTILFTASATLVVLLLGGGLAVKVGAAENSYNEVVTFSEVLSLVLDNYVDPVDADRLLQGAYEGMLGGLDPNGAYLTAEEVADWKSGRSGDAGPGLSVLKGGRALQVVAVDEGSAAQEAGIRVGDHIRSVDGLNVRDLSLTQSWRRLQGEPGTSVALDIVHPADGFAHETVALPRVKRQVRPYELDVRRGIAVLRVFDMQRLDPAALAEELDDVRSRGIEALLLDLRNLADLQPRDATRIAALFTDGAELRLRDRAGRLVETLEAPQAAPVWPGPIAALVNGATAGSGEALASMLKAGGKVRVLGESTYGLGAEVKLFELENGSGLLVSSALWETGDGASWNSDGVVPDEEVEGHGDDYAAASADQLERALDVVERVSAEHAAAPAGAA